MFEKVKENLAASKKILFDASSVQSALDTDPLNRELYLSSIDAFRQQLIFLNDAIPDLLNGDTPNIEDKKVKKEMKKVESDNGMVATQVGTKDDKSLVTISKKDKKEFMQKLKLTDGALKKVQEVKKKEDDVNVFSKPSAYVVFSNKIFRKTSDRLSVKFEELGKNLKKANSRYMLSSYLSMALMSILIAGILGLIFFGYMMFVSFSNWAYIAVPFGLVAIVAFLFYIYPSNEAGAVQKKISQELPFVAIYMAAIAGSNIEPLKIFKIIASSEDYPNVAREFRKVVAQIEVYGYDLVMAFKNVTARTSNKDLAELFSGIATNISTGGALKNYLEKKSENFLTDYKLDRQKYSALAGTFMDVYISILIAAPLIMTMMFIVMNVAGLGLGGMSLETLMVLGVVAISIANVIFLFVLNAKQPKV